MWLSAKRYTLFVPAVINPFVNSFICELYHFTQLVSYFDGTCAGQINVL